MKILKIGTFDKLDGSPTGWHLDMNDIPEGQYGLGIDVLGPGVVDVNGVEIVEWTQKRKKIMEGDQ